MSVVVDRPKFIKASLVSAAIICQHQDHYSLDPKQLMATINTPIVVEGRNVLSRSDVGAAGLLYREVGTGR
jgi:hypothetical protein